MQLSEVDIHYDTVNSNLRKQIRDGIPLTIDEIVELQSILGTFENLTCYKDENICKPDTCRFAGIPDEWVLYEGFPYLCDLICNHIENGPNLKPPKCDVMSVRCKLLPGSGFSWQ